MTDSAPRAVGGMRDVQAALGGSCRTAVEDLLRNDPDFPAPISVGQKRVWFLDEIANYLETRPRRRYADPDV